MLTSPGKLIFIDECILLLSVIKNKLGVFKMNISTSYVRFQTKDVLQSLQVFRLNVALNISD